MHEMAQIGRSHTAERGQEWQPGARCHALAEARGAALADARAVPDNGDGGLPELFWLFRLQVR